MYMVLYHSFMPVLSIGTYFHLVAGTDEKSSAVDKTPHIRREFFQCGREKSCTHVVKLTNGYAPVLGSVELEKRIQEALCVYKKILIPSKTIPCSLIVVC